MTLLQTLKQAAKTQRSRWRVAWAQRFGAYGPPELLAALRRIGVRPGDCVMLHSAFSGANGFRGTIPELIDSFVEAVRPQGHLMMVSLPYRTASLDWLQSGRRFDVRRTPSMMGLVSETFRRRGDVLRSLHPTHPILVHGPRARQIVDAHPECLYPCGPGTPFEELLKLDGCSVFFNVPIDTFTFFHYLEHHVCSSLPFPLYTEQPFDSPVVDADGLVRIVRTYAFARDAIQRRRPERLYDELRARKLVRRARVGASELLAVRVRDALTCTDELLRRGKLFYDMPPA
ncbi:MAG: AAC(3) family N-acetyltransferase [Burkholderiaceae bacterium]